jgi:ring-1,2-phenylacetyl-CoA epoxidase subunit PaaC
MTTNNQSLFKFVLGLADDSVVLGHRLSEWCSNGPYLEEDIALSNVALDYVGRARMFYQYAAEIEGKGRSEDDLAYWRDERQYTNLLIHELPIGDFGFTMVRQFLVDAFYVMYLEALCDSTDETIAAIATKALKESRYHLKRSQPWITQLAQGTEVSREYIVEALDELQNFVGELFEMPDWEKELVAQGIAVDRQALQGAYDQYVQNFLAQSDLSFKDSDIQIRGGREGIHTEHLGHMLCEMQYVQREYPGLEW